MASAEVAVVAPSARRISRAESVLADVAIRLPDRRDSLDALVRIATPEISYKVRTCDSGTELIPDDGKPVASEFTASVEVWGSVVAGEFNVLEAVDAGLMTIRGNVHLAMDFGGMMISDSPYPWHYNVDRVKVGKLKVARLVTKIPDSGHLSATDSPRGHRPALVLHGLSATKSSMLPTIVGLAEDREVHAIDHPGHGDSDKPYVSYSPSFLAGTVIRYLDAIGAEKVDLIGNSLGGRVSLEVAARWPDRVGRMVLYAPAMAPIKDRNLISLLKVVPSSIGMIPGIFTRGRAEMVMRSLLGGLDGAGQSLIDAAVDDFLRIYSTAGARRALYSALRGYLLADSFGDGGFWTNMPRIRSDALFIWGRHDDLVSWRYSRATSQWMPHAVSVIYEDGGHVPQIEHPERTNKMTRDFFDGVLPQPSPAVTMWSA